MNVLLDSLVRLGNQLPPRLKALLNLAITVTLAFVAIPLLWIGVSSGSGGDLALGTGLLLMAIFNLFT